MKEVFLAVFEEPIPDESLKKLSKSSYYHISDRAVFILWDVKGMDTLAGNLGILSGKRIGIVFRLGGAHIGNHYDELWQWLAKARGES